MNLEREIKRYSGLNGYPITQFKHLSCSCGGSEFYLFSDDNEGGAFAICTACSLEQDIENSKRYIEEKQQNICNCDNEKLNIGIGKAYFEGSKDLRWIYVGAECNDCGLSGVYVDWKES
jgi:hypothetical protein